MRERAEQLRNEIMRGNTDSEDMQEEFIHLQKKVFKMVNLFKKAQF